MISAASQLALFELCDVCHGPYIGQVHPACWRALQHWVPMLIEYYGLPPLDHVGEA